MSDSVSFKAYLKRDGQEVEVRRFGIDGGAATNFMCLCSKIQAMFPCIKKDQFQVFWQDIDKDYIRVDSDEELLEALTSSNQQPLKVYVQVQNNTYQGAATSGRSQTHPRVVCNGCDSTVQGFLYRCVTCPDFDLCSRCENNGFHPEHFMLRMPTAMDSFLNQPKFLRKLFTQPHKFHKRHGWSRRGCGDSHNRAEQCPRATLAGVTDMFDFSALMQFIESLGVANQPEPAREERDQNSSTGETATPILNNSQNCNETLSDPRAKGSSRASECLNNIGQVVAAILDPLGVDVTFDVCTKTSQQQVPTASTSASPIVVTTASTSASPIVVTTASTSVSATTVNTASTAPPTPLIDVSSIGSQTQTEFVKERHNSDDWTLINRESPTQNEAAAMDVDNSQGVKLKTMLPLSPTAPPNIENLSDVERRRIQEAVETFRAMGFTFNTDTLTDLLQKQNGDILSVLEIMLNSEKK